MIALENVSKRYGNATALKGISFEIPRGQIVGFLGPNGAGKTTTMKIITGFIAPTSGSVRIDGLDVLEKSLDVRSRIGYLPENAPVYQEMRVSEYLDFVGRIRQLSGDTLKRRREEVIRLTGLDKVVHKDINTLSKGYRQRVGLAQALIHNPPILILDEPTSGLDPNQIVEIRDVIRQIGSEKTVMLSTHILSEVEATTDRVLIISQGELVADGTTADLQARQRAARVRGLLEATADDSPERLTAQLQTLPGVRQARVEPGDGPHLFHMTLETDGTDDRGLRRALFAQAVAHQWVLLELSRQEQSLEAIFQTLTRAGGASV